MSLSDCEKCWDTPCSCGWHWRNYPVESLAKYLVSVVSEQTPGDQIKILAKALKLCVEKNGLA